MSAINAIQPAEPARVATLPHVRPLTAFGRHPNSIRVVMGPRRSLYTPLMSSSLAPVYAAPNSTPRTRWPGEWKKFTRVDGVVYFTSDNGRLITTDDVSDATTRDVVVATYNHYNEWFEGIDAEDGEMFIFNAALDPIIYLASWSLGETYEFTPDGEELVVESDAKYWDYAWRFPMHRTYLPAFREEEFRGALAFGSNERARNRKLTTFPLKDPQIRRMMRIYYDLKEGHTAHCNLIPALVYHVARTYKWIARRWSPCPGQNVRVLDGVLALALCGTHHNYRTRLQATVPAGGILLSDFRQLMRKLLSEWADSNLVATVVLSVNIGFLGLPNLQALHRSASLVSSLCAMASLITGLHHVWQHREKINTEHDDAVEYLYFLKPWCQRTPRKLAPTALDLTLTASLLALPLAALQWALLSLATAIATYAFQSTTEKTGHLLFLVLVGLLAGLSFCVFLIFWRFRRTASRYPSRLD
ncbi:hypothetical protein B0H16DRAFT_1807751 [Mycena metata]|uniref:WW domain-containing protein n=1 Tax=Mycena metata TaxID=1033252 RepID=A0AAD7H8L9_9AGAR|nr:hypothetical protein B0H16DRAFT_1807751 [Mycena metata]